MKHGNLKSNQTHFQLEMDLSKEEVDESTRHKWVTKSSGALLLNNFGYFQVWTCILPNYTDNYKMQDIL